MSENEISTKDKECIIAFRKLIGKRKAVFDEKLRLQWLEGLRTDYEILRPLLLVSEPCKEEIHRMITQAINKL